MLNLQQLMAVKSRRERIIELPELGGQLRAASLSAAAAAKFRSLIKRQAAGEDIENELTRLILLSTCVDDAGKPLFDEASVDAFLATTDVQLVARIIDEISPLLRKPDATETPAAPGNSEASPSAA